MMKKKHAVHKTSRVKPKWEEHQIEIQSVMSAQ